MQPLYFSFIFLFLSLFSSMSAAQPDSLIVSVAPSFPKPVSGLEPLEQIMFEKKSKFFSNIEPRTPEELKLKLAKKAKQAKTLRLKTAYAKAELAEKVPTKLEAWKSVFEFISKKSGVTLKFEPAKSQLEFELKLAKGYYDLAYVNPLQFNAFRDFPGYQAQVKRKSQPLRGIIFVKQNSSIKTLAQLRDSIIAVPGALNFAASVVPRESLRRLKFSIIPQFLANENTVFYEVARGQYMAGSGTTESFLAQPPEIRNALVKIWDSPGFSPFAFVAHPRVPFYSLVKLKQAMVRMIKEEDGKNLLTYIFAVNGFETARNSDWDEIKQIDLDALNGSSVSTKVTPPLIGE